MVNLNELQEAIVAGKLEVTVELAENAIKEGIEPQQIITDYMIPGMKEIGARFEAGKAFVPHLLMSSRAMKGALEILKPLMKGGQNTSYGTVVIGTVKGDLHDIGKNLVAIMLAGCGFEVINLGVDISIEKFVQSVQDNNPDILCMSSLLTTTMEQMHQVIVALQDAGLRSKVKIMVGGSPVSKSFARNIGADGYSSNANGAVAVARQLLGR